ncbi:sodium-dependent glucose transporter 1A isoform X2 [Eurytemora carolleeae]|uniref:sodium-dependent glucose transporter 1A isoform X2 n=1 Tax=Eurytemora carolleeae TaxID=1294199 RepID=UPI000C782C3E|nr:sodium-dependent glucose transporter 1A isoform X2 [Eurytemora carolleeae]|eukprot:XP_023332152.1 sodium-dependent glucose transporter 1A-like isoform X2 [Eurytemora affinis]
MFGLDRDSSIWLSIYFPVSWLTQFGHGLVTTVVGPTQPYLARNTGVAIDTVNLVWTFGFIGFLLGSLLTGFIFKQFITSARGKLIFLFSSISLTGIFVVVLPLTSSFPLLVTGRLIQHFMLGAFITADASLIVFLIGPEKSRPFTMFLHAVIGSGFLAATILVRPFLPSEESVNKDTLCNRINTTLERTKDELSLINPEPNSFLFMEEDHLLPTIAWPFIISGVWCIFFSFGFLILACLPYRMPRFYEYEAGSKIDEKSTKSIRFLPAFFSIVFLFYAVSCGIERIYQPMATTFGLCGPLDLSPKEAVATDSFYNGGFMCGRLVSAVVAGFVAPRNMILISLVSCVLAAVLLCILAGTNVYGLYGGTAILVWILFLLGCEEDQCDGTGLFSLLYRLRSWKFGNPSDIRVYLYIKCLIFLLLWFMARNVINSSDSGSESYQLPSSKN